MTGAIGILGGSLSGWWEKGKLVEREGLVSLQRLTRFGSDSRLGLCDQTDWLRSSGVRQTKRERLWKQVSQSDPP